MTSDEPDPDERSNAPGRLRLSRRRFLLLLAAAAASGAAALEGLHQALIEPGLLRPAISPPTPAPGLVLPVESGPIESGPPLGPNRVARENTLRGSPRWQLPLTGKGDAEGYLGDVSGVPGQTLALHLSSRAPAVTVTAYRLGWYQGTGARRVGNWKDLRVRPQPTPTTDPVTGLIRCAWEPTLTFAVPGDWVSGLYLLLIEPTGGTPQYVPFIVREAATQAPILYISASTTYQAYNAWGGKSLYAENSTGVPTISGGPNAVKASFDRPFDDYRGGGRLLRWEPPFIRWMEANGVDVAYAADVDLERNPGITQGRRLIVFAGHPEYWSVGMRRTLEAAIGSGTNVAFFSANEIYWRIRYEDEAGGRYRSVTCYRYQEIDPLTAQDPEQSTTQWRAGPSPDPESLVIGQMFGHQLRLPADFVCSQPTHWIYGGTGMQLGDVITNLVGQEYDRYWPDPGLSPSGVTILATSPVQPNYGRVENLSAIAQNEPQPPVHNATIYTAGSGATIFAAGTMQWSWGLDDWGNQEFQGVHTPVDPRVQRITHNILTRLST